MASGAIEVGNKLVLSAGGRSIDVDFSGFDVDDIATLTDAQKNGALLAVVLKEAVGANIGEDLPSYVRYLTDPEHPENVNLARADKSDLKDAMLFMLEFVAKVCNVNLFRLGTGEGSERADSLLARILATHRSRAGFGRTGSVVALDAMCATYAAGEGLYAGEEGFAGALAWFKGQLDEKVAASNCFAMLEQQIADEQRAQAARREAIARVEEVEEGAGERIVERPLYVVNINSNAPAEGGDEEVGAQVGVRVPAVDIYVLTGSSDAARVVTTAAVGFAEGRDGLGTVSVGGVSFAILPANAAERRRPEQLTRSLERDFGDASLVNSETKKRVVDTARLVLSHTTATAAPPVAELPAVDEGEPQREGEVEVVEGVDQQPREEEVVVRDDAEARDEEPPVAIRAILTRYIERQREWIGRMLHSMFGKVTTSKTQLDALEAEHSASATTPVSAI